MPPSDKRRVSAYLRTSARALLSIDSDSILRMSELLWDTWRKDGAVLICGNGGSAAVASALATDLCKEADIPGYRPLRALALTDSVETLTAWSNDAGYNKSFSEQVRVHGRPGDMLICISCSGNSPNLLAAVDQAREQNMTVASWVGLSGGRLQQVSDHSIHVPSEDYGMIESAFTSVHHCITSLLSERAETELVVEVSQPTGGPIIFLDRDGVINKNLKDGVRNWEDFEFIPGSLDAIAELTRRGCRIVVVTNQANIGRGLLSPAALTDIHRRMVREIIKHGGSIEAIYHCPHLPDSGCECRKPKPGMLQTASLELGFDLYDSFLIGDDYDDIGAAHNATVRSILVLSGRTTIIQPSNHPQPIKIAADLSAAVTLLEEQGAFDKRMHNRPKVSLVQ